MPRLYFPLTVTSGSIHITGEKAKYLTRVLRSKIGDDIVLFDGRGSSCKAVIRSIAKNDVLAEITGVVRSDTESRIDIVLIQSLLKGEKMDLVIQKASELGVKEITPAITERSQVRHTGKLVRWRKIAEDASRQCGRSVIPVIREPVKLDAWLLKSSPVNGIIFWEEGGSPLKETLTKISSSPGLPIKLLIGPEGGFTEDEVKMAARAGFVVTSLGNRILRAETAAISATAIVQFLLGDLG